MRATNDYFWQQRGIDRDSLTEDRVVRWQDALNMPRNVTYTRPPDYRIMFVEEDVNRNPLENGSNPLWFQACDDVYGMRDDEWEERLTWTRDRVRENTRRIVENGPGDEHQNRHGLFVRYLVWNECIAGT